MSKLVVSEFVTLDGIFEDPVTSQALRLVSTRPAGDTVILTLAPRELA